MHPVMELAHPLRFLLQIRDIGQCSRNLVVVPPKRIRRKNAAERLQTNLLAFGGVIELIDAPICTSVSRFEVSQLLYKLLDLHASHCRCTGNSY